MTYVCTQNCYWRDQFWCIGDQVEVDEKKDTPSHLKIPSHFRKLTKELKEDIAADAAKCTPTDDSEDSLRRMELKSLCSKAGIMLNENATIAQMQTALKEKNIVVN